VSPLSGAGILLATVLLAATMSSGAVAGSAERASRVDHGIAYCTDDGTPRYLDLYRPAGGSGRSPVVLWIHGGGWVGGSRRDAAHAPSVAALRAAGFTVAAIDYVLAPQGRFPAQIQDLTCGVRFLRANARRFGIDARRIGALGVSAGGHLAGLLGVNNGSPMFVRGGDTRYSSRVQAVATLAGVFDLTLPGMAGHDGRGLRNILPSVFGPPSGWWAASPRAYVRPGLPPFLFVHGDDDDLVPLEQSRKMRTALRVHGNDARLIAVHNAGHVLTPQGAPVRPSLARVMRQVVAFFLRTLGR
jgi:acetyl esterase/lipase